MKNKRTHKHAGRLFRNLLSFGLLAALTGIASVAGATYSLPTARSVTWQGNVGVLNDIPSRTTTYTTLKPSGGDDTSAIQAAINNCPSGQVVSLSAGTFSITGNILMKSGVTVRGAGMGQTILVGTGTTSAYMFAFIGSGYSWDLSNNPTITISAGATKGSTSITTSTAHGWAAGDVILIDQLQQPSGDPVITQTGNQGNNTWDGRGSGTRTPGQLVKVTAVPDSTHATLEIPLYWNYQNSTPQAVKVSGLITNAGIEDLTIDNTASGNGSNQSSNGTIMMVASNCWLSKVEGIGTYVSMVRLYYSYRNTIRGCKFHEGVGTPAPSSSYGPGRGYGIRFSPYASANLVENNQVYHVSVGVMTGGNVTGNVIAYNYITDLYYQDTAWIREGIGFHSNHPMMNLVEGNFTDGCWLTAADNIWGSSSHNVFFRNKSNLRTDRTSGLFNVMVGAHQQYYSYIGNVLGTPGKETVYSWEGLSGSITTPAIYAIGYWNSTSLSTSSFDSAVPNTMLRHGNWDSVHNSVVWNNGDDTTLPSSMYLSSKPAWWGSIQWPCIGPDVSPMYPTPLAVGAGTPWGGSGSSSSTQLTPPTNLRIQ